jgi:hypothetical protein
LGQSTDHLPVIPAFSTGQDDAPRELAHGIDRFHPRGDVMAAQGGLCLGALRVGRAAEERLAVALAVGLARAVGLAVHQRPGVARGEGPRYHSVDDRVLPILLCLKLAALLGGLFYAHRRRPGKGLRAYCPTKRTAAGGELGGGFLFRGLRVLRAPSAVQAICGAGGGSRRAGPSGAREVPATFFANLRVVTIGTERGFAVDSAGFPALP